MSKVSELAGAELDYWVARAEGAEQYYPEYSTNPERFNWLKQGNGNAIKTPPFSSSWCAGGPLIEKRGISLMPDSHIDNKDPVPGVWYAQSWADAQNDVEHEGPTPLIAAMRALVASVYGEEVPEVAP